ncbi:uncharacterized protein MELLADRAFT_68775 [Melampsora larici-populina 98AG31]|uniref:Uncharacterized protein n=1 Tax=Melampsora larici-populina (strain 98AG31 / pathotype 3-4-7) TaxID=747676 RepID=F4S845_MELLP|nr:uncharacterized protein MELLADRAFT_68775 [Melampsora larici-populina 98AG31]EGF99125.1 hypothetical protein MELLADRAFT_68775 [Melampsora larici-populina 98AG31]
MLYNSVIHNTKSWTHTFRRAKCFRAGVLSVLPSSNMKKVIEIWEGESHYLVVNSDLYAIYNQFKELMFAFSSHRLPMVWSLTRNDMLFNRSKEITQTMRNTLHSVAPSYDPKTYTPVQVLQLLAPAAELVEIRDDIARMFRVAIITALVDLSLLSILYAPLIYATLKVLRKRSRELRFTFATATADKADQFAHIKARLEEEHSTIVHHAWSAYITTVSFIPVLAWLVGILVTYELINLSN